MVLLSKVSDTNVGVAADTAAGAATELNPAATRTAKPPAASRVRFRSPRRGSRLRPWSPEPACSTLTQPLPKHPPDRRHRARKRAHLQGPASAARRQSIIASTPKRRRWRSIMSAAREEATSSNDVDTLRNGRLARRPYGPAVSDGEGATLIQGEFPSQSRNARARTRSVRC